MHKITVSLNKEHEIYLSTIRLFTFLRQMRIIKKFGVDEFYNNVDKFMENRVLIVRP